MSDRRRNWWPWVLLLLVMLGAKIYTDVAVGRAKRAATRQAEVVAELKAGGWKELPEARGVLRELDKRIPDGADPILVVEGERKPIAPVRIRVPYPVPGPIVKVPVEVPGDCADAVHQALDASDAALSFCDSMRPPDAYVLLDDLGADSLGVRCRTEVVAVGGRTLANVLGQATLALEHPDDGDVSISTPWEPFDELEIAAAVPTRPQWPREREILLGLTSRPGALAGFSWYREGSRFGLGVLAGGEFSDELVRLAIPAGPHQKPVSLEEAVDGSWVAVAGKFRW